MLGASKMDNKEHIEKLKTLKVTRGKGALFESASECMDWIDKVIPLLKYNKDHYETFLFHANECTRFAPSDSPGLIMPHLNKMISVVNQAITELETNRTPPKPNIAPKPPTNKAKNKHDLPQEFTSKVVHWHEKPLGKIAIGVIIILFATFVIWVIRHCFSIKL